MNRSSNLVRAALLASFLGVGCSSASDDAPSGAPEGQATGADSTQATSGTPELGAPGAPGAAGAAGRDGHQRVFGDGSAGALEITKDTVFDEKVPADGNLAFASIHIAAGATLTVPSGTTLRATGKVDIEGKLVVQSWATPYGALGIAMTGRAGCEGTSYYAVGGLSWEPRGGEGIGAATTRYGLPSTGAMGGGSGCGNGNGSKGGGRITVASGADLTIGATGAIVADGDSTHPAAHNEGAGGGGFIILGSASSVTVLGSLSARGGTPVQTIAAPMQAVVFGGGGGGGGGILLFAPVVDTEKASLSVAGGIAPALPILPTVYTFAYYTGGGGGGAVGDGGSGGFHDGYGSKLHAAQSGKPGAILTQKTHPANSSLF